MVLIKTIDLAAALLLSSFLVACTSELNDRPTSEVREVPADLLIEEVTVIDAVHGLRRGMDVFISGNMISAVLEHNVPSKISARKIVNARGKYLIPGLWDAHVHTTFTPALSEGMVDLFIANGITSIRDTGGQLGSVLAWREMSKHKGGPTVYIAGPLIDGTPTVYDGKIKHYPEISISAATPQQVILAVDDLAAAGVDLIKAYEMLSPAAFRALIVQAAKHGLPVTGHVPLSMTAVEAAQAGLNSMEHMRNLEMDCSSRAPELFTQRQRLLLHESSKPGSNLRSEIHSAQHFEAVRTYDADRCALVLQQLLTHDVWQIPTATLMFASLEPYYVEEQWRKTFDFLPKDVRKAWLASTDRYKQSLQEVSPARQQRARVADWKKQMVKQFVEVGIPIMAGTDTPIFFLTPGFSLHKELQTLVSAGMTPLQVLESATLAPAKYFGIDDKQGVISPNMLADLVLLNSNPLNLIANTSDINSVIRQGELLARGQLDQRLKRAKRAGR